MNTTRANTETLLEKSILIVEDEPDIAELIRLHLCETYKTVTVVNDGLAAKSIACSQIWDLIILDIRLPGKNGLDLCRELRAEQRYMPILMLTSKSSELDKVLGLEVGADDYVTKPFSVIELAARVNAIFRRITAAQKNPEVISDIVQSQVHDITLDHRHYKFSKKGQTISLTTKEFDLMSYFLQKPDTVFSRSHLLNRVWGSGHEGYEHTVNSHINRLRAKIEDDPTKPKIIATVWGVGYKLTV